jgi:hypothetical protein
MPSSVIGALRVNLGLDSAAFNRGATDAERRAYKMGENIGKAIRSPIASIGSLKGAIGGLAGALALKELAGATQRAFDYADSIQDLADRSGASTKAIQEFRFAAQLSGSSVEVADAATEKFARTLGLAQQGSDAQVKLFRELGVTSTDFDTALRQTLDGIAKLPTVQQRAATGFQIFGKSSATLTGLLGQGSRGFDELAQKAQDLGIVLKDDVIRNAGGANDKLDTLKMILSAQFANAVVQNANSLVAMADGLTSLTSAVLKFLSANPAQALAIIGGLAGSRAGPIGAAAGAIAGYAGGTVLKRNADDGNTDLKFRRQQFRQAIADRKAAAGARSSGTLFSVRKGGGTGSSAEVVRQGKLYQDAIAAARGGAGRNVGALPTVGTGEAKTAEGKAASEAKSQAAEAKRLAAERERAAEKALADEKRYQSDLARTQSDELSARLDLTVDATRRAELESDRLQQESTADIEQVRLDKDLTEAQKAALIAIMERTSALQQDLIDRRKDQEVAAQALESAQNRLANEQDILQSQVGLARTAKERGRIEKEILDNQFEALKLAQQVIIDNKGKANTPQQIADAQKRLGTLGQLQNYAAAKSARDNQGPLASYLDGIPKSADEVSEAIEGIEANGLSSLIDGLSKVEGGFKGLASTVKNVANEIISSLIKIGLQKGIAALFGNVMGATTGSGSFSSSSFLNSGSGPTSGGYSFAGARAKGGPVTAGKMYMVGERGPERFIPNSSGTIIPNDALGVGRGDTNYYNFTIPGGVDFATRTEAARFAQAAYDAVLAKQAETSRRSAR